MNTNTICRFCGKLLLLAALCAPLRNTAQDAVTMTTASSDGVATENVTYMTATVTAVDQKARTVTLKGPEGNEMTMEVGTDVKRLDEIKPGDQLEVGYVEAVGLEFRQATAEEMKDPLKVTDVTERADRKDAPAAGTMRTVRAVVTLEGMSRWLNTLTVRGPKGNYFIVDVGPGVVKWEDLRIGQTMVGTYAEAVIMSISPAAKQ